jgi:hypothetical protein
MLIINKLKREVKDYEIATKCNTNCLCCPTYMKVKDMAKCEVRKARARIINRKFREIISKR